MAPPPYSGPAKVDKNEPNTTLTEEQLEVVVEESEKELVFMSLESTIEKTKNMLPG